MKKLILALVAMLATNAHATGMDARMATTAGYAWAIQIACEAYGYQRTAQMDRVIKGASDPIFNVALTEGREQAIASLKTYGLSAQWCAKQLDTSMRSGLIVRP